MIWINAEDVIRAVQAQETEEAARQELERLRRLRALRRAIRQGIVYAQEEVRRETNTAQELQRN